MSQVKFNPMHHGDVENAVSVLKESIDAGNLATPGKKQLQQPRIGKPVNITLYDLKYVNIN